MGKQMVRVAMNTSNFLGQTGLYKSSIAQSRMCCIALFFASGNPSVQKVPIPQASALRSKKHFAKMRSLHPPDAEHKGFGHSPTSILNLDFKKSDSKIASWYQLALLASTAYRKTPVSIFTSDFSWKKPCRRTSACRYTSEGMYEKEETHL